MSATRIRCAIVGAAFFVFSATPPSAAQCAETWLKGQGAPGLSFSPHALTFWDPDGSEPAPENIVVGGGRLVLAFDGTRWTTLGDEFNETVESLTVFQGQLIVGGYFTAVGALPVGHAARWNGIAWEAFGDLSALVRGFGTFQGELITFGDFPGHVARWDGSEWQTIGALGSGSVRDAVELDGDLYICIGGPDRVARWDGASWQQVGPNFNASVNALAAFDGHIIAGGAFTSPTRYISQWDGTHWVALGNSFQDSVTIYHLGVFQNELIAAGAFTTASQVKDLARWDGSTWKSLGVGPDDTVNELAISPGRVAISGYFTNAGGVPANEVAQWDGAAWTAVDEIPRANPVEGRIYAFQEYDGDLIAGGTISKAGAVDVQNLARWDGSAWHNFDLEFDGANTQVLAMLPYRGSLIVAGTFTTLNGGAITANNIVRWDGAELHPMSAGMTPRVYTLALFNDELVAGGSFLFAGRSRANGVARWSGSEWLPMRAGIDEGWARAMTVYRGELIAGGFFRSVDGVNAHNIAAWDGTNWHALGVGLNDIVRALTVFNDELIAGGSFTQAGGEPAMRVARWDGDRWASLGSGISGGSGVETLLVRNDELIVGGTFDQAGDILTHGVARWNGTSWRALDGGLNGIDKTVYSLGQYHDELVVGGTFTLVGNIASTNWARWGYACCRGDFNADGTIDLSDLGVLLSDYGCTGGNCPGDTDGDGNTDLSDLGVVLSAYGTSCN